MAEPENDALSAFMGAHDCRKCPPLQLSDEGQEILEAMGGWQVFGPGRIAAVRRLRVELLALQKEKGKGKEEGGEEQRAEGP